MGNILTFGEIMGRIEMEHHFRFSQALPGQVRITFAGAEANVAASLSIMGKSTRFVTALPKNPVADACIAYLKSLDVGTEYIQRTNEGRLGLYFLEAGANQRPSNVVYDREFSAIAVTPAEAYDWDAICADVEWFHFSGITPAISRTSTEALTACLKAVKARGIPVSCDLNFRKKLWKWDPEYTQKELARKTMKTLLPYVDVIIGNEEDAADVMDIHPANSDVQSGKLDVSRYTEVAEEAVRQYPHLTYVAFTLRESISASHNNWGAMIYDPSQKKSFFAPLDGNRYAPYEIRNIIDRVGGGDSFSAGLIYALTDKELSTPDKAIAYATAASCLCHSINGDINYSSKSEIIALMNGNASGRVVR